MSPADAQLSLFPDLPPASKLRRTISRTRLFFALWPAEDTRERIAQAAALIPPGDAARAYRVKPARYHLTLAFLGNLTQPQRDAAASAAAAVSAPAFELKLDCVGHFAGPNVAWIGPQRVPPPLARLKAALDRELLHRSLPVEVGPFRPHITCVRGVRAAPDAEWLDMQGPAIAWHVREFVLVRSVLKPGASSYKIVGRWPLRAEVAMPHSAQA